MFRKQWPQLIYFFVLIMCTPLLVYATDSGKEVQDHGVSVIWVLANISYAGMRAQDSPNKGWRILAFIFGLGGTLISFFAVKEGSERAYGIDLPRRRSGL